MNDKRKQGFFGRLFGSDKPAEDADANTKPVDEKAVADKDNAEAKPSEDLADDVEAGPPETTPEWLAEHGEDDAPTEPAPTTATSPQYRPDAESKGSDPIESKDQPAPSIAAEEEPEAPKKNWFQRLTSGLRRSSDQLASNLTAVFTKRKLDDATLEDLEDILIQADLGIETAMSITDKLRAERYDKEISAEEVQAMLAEEVRNVLEPVAKPLAIDGAQKPFVILMVGVNGSGKTTTIGKFAKKFTEEGKSVMLAAGDTFRAAAVEQLQVWGERANVPVITRPTGADASGLAYDAYNEAKAAGTDILIIDTAGRLQNRDELMAELEKIIRVIKKLDENAPHATLLTLDATTGQNALNQVEIFGKRAGVTGLVMTKLDGTARGGILVAIATKFQLPVHFIGVGESAEDLQSFAASDFAEAIAGKELK